MSKLIGAAAVIVDDQQRVLLVRHSYGKLNWDLPGGKAESQESAEQTAVREVSEEVGLNIAIQQLTGIYYEPQHDMHHFVFTATYNQHQQSPIPSSPEILECGFFNVDKLPRPMKDFTYRRIKHAYEKERKHLFHLVESISWLE